MILLLFDIFIFKGRRKYFTPLAQIVESHGRTEKSVWGIIHKFINTIISDILFTWNAKIKN